MAPVPSRADGPERGQRLREIPGLPRRERTWKDEVRERVAARKRRRASGLGGRLDSDPDSSEEPASSESLGHTPGPERSDSLPAARWDVAAPTPELEPPHEYTLGDHAPEPAVTIETAVAGPPAGSGPEPPASRDLLDDLPLVSSEPERVEPAADDLLDDPDDGDWDMDLAPPPRVAGQVERPAYPGERLAAASLDGILLTGLASVVLYFASRAAQTPVAGLAPSWPWLAAYLAFLGLVYSACFTGVTGQTPGKMWAGLRVVSSTGAAPSAWSAGLRAALGAIGVVFLGVGLVPMFLDPARRALHDRIFGTRVVRR